MRFRTFVVSAAVALMAIGCTQPAPGGSSLPDPNVLLPQTTVLEEGPDYALYDNDTVVLGPSSVFEMSRLLNHDSCDKYDLPSGNVTSVLLPHMQCFQVLTHDHLRLNHTNDFFQAFVADSADTMANATKWADRRQCIWLQRTAETGGVPVVALDACPPQFKPSVPVP